MPSRAPSTIARPSKEEEERDSDSHVAPTPSNQQVIENLKKKSIIGTMEGNGIIVGSDGVDVGGDGATAARAGDGGKDTRGGDKGPRGGLGTVVLG